jgi:tetratricopeptide (TPR) repeat protein
VFWVHAGTQARVEEGFRTIADAVKLPGRNQPKANIPQLVYGWLANGRNGRWMMILDNADDCGVFYGPTSGDAPTERPFATYLPQSQNGSILITTRDKELAFRLTGRRQNMMEIGPMAQTDALTLLEKKLGSLPAKDVAADLVQALDLVPLAISQAAAYIQARAPRSSPEKYLAEFREDERKRTRLLEYDAGDLRRDRGASNAIITTWRISFDHIRSKRRSAADLLSLMSFFDPQGIPRWVLKPSSGMQGDGKSDDGGNAPDSDTYDAGDDIDGGFEDDVAMLRDYCLIIAGEAGDEFEMHGLVQLSTRRWLEAFGEQETFKQQYIERMAASFPTGKYENWATCESLFAHVQVAFGYRPSEDTVEAWAALLHNGGSYARLQGRYDVAQQMLAKARRVREKRRGEEDAETLASTSLFAMVLADRGRWEEAEKLHMQVLETRKIKLGADHPVTLESMDNLASTYWGQGRWAEAEKLEVQVLETRKSKLGADNPDTLTSMANLATTYANQGRWEEAEKLGVQVLETRKIKLGADHPDTLTSMANLASTYWGQGRWEEAEKLQVQVLEARKSKLGADHPDTLTSMAKLASTYWKQGRWEEAEKLQVQVLEARKTKLGADHPDTLINMANLAFTWRDRGRYADALALMRSCAQTRQRVLGPKHPDTLFSLATLDEWSS